MLRIKHCIFTAVLDLLIACKLSDVDLGDVTYISDRHISVDTKLCDDVFRYLVFSNKSKVYTMFIWIRSYQLIGLPMVKDCEVLSKYYYLTFILVISEHI